MLDAQVAALKEHLGQIADLQSAAAVLHWDQEVYMPPKGAEARGSQLATLQALAHRAFVSQETVRLLEPLEAQSERLPFRVAKLAVRPAHCRTPFRRPAKRRASLPDGQAHRA